MPEINPKVLSTVPPVHQASPVQRPVDAIAPELMNRDNAITSQDDHGSPQHYGTGVLDAQEPLDARLTSFEQFQRDAKKQVERIDQGITEYKKELFSDDSRKNFESSEEFLNAKKAHIDSKVERNLAQYRARPVYVQNDADTLVEKKMHELQGSLVPIVKDPHHPEFWDAKLALLALHGDGYFSRSFKLDSLRQALVRPEEHVDHLFESLQLGKVNEKTSLTFDPGKQRCVKGLQSIPSEQQQAWKTELFEAARNGDPGAQALSWANQAYFVRLEEPDAAEKTVTQLKRMIVQWKSPIKLDNKIIPWTENDIPNLVPQIENRAKEFQEKYESYKKQTLLQPHLAQHLPKAKELAAKKLHEASSYIQSEDVQRADVAHQEAIQKAEDDASEKMKNLKENIFKEVEKSFNSDDYFGSDHLMEKVLYDKLDSYEEEKSLPYLRFFANASLAEFSPKQIVIAHPSRLGNDDLSTFRGTSANISHNQFGDIVLSFPRNDQAKFEKIQFLKKENGHEHFRITEQKETGEQESFTLIAGGTNLAGKACVQILCDTGECTDLTFGDAPLYPVGVRKPIIAFRNIKDPIAIRINVEFSGRYDLVYPEAKQRGSTLLWEGIVHHDTRICVDGKYYPYLFWDGKLASNVSFAFNEGFCIERSKTVEFLERHALAAGLDETLATDFVTFWAPYLMVYPYALVRFLSLEECELIAKLNIESNNEGEMRLIRFYMIFRPLDTYQDISCPSNLDTQQCDEIPTVIEWGGFIQ